MNSYLVLVAACISLVSCAPSPSSDGAVHPDYSPLINAVRTTTDFDGRPELRQCQAEIELSADRGPLSIEIARRGMTKEVDHILIEASVAGWGGYYYAYIWKRRGDGRIVTNMSSKNWGHKIDREVAISSIDKLLDALESKDGLSTGFAGKTVSDGLCLFVTFQKGDSIGGFSAYGSRELLMNGDSTAPTPSARDVLEFIEGLSD